jgi:hypothetical protein
MSKSSETFINRKTERTPDEKNAPAAKQTKNSGPEAGAGDSLICPCFPHINIEDQITDKSQLIK